jgi:hypothetical protein
MLITPIRFLGFLLAALMATSAPAQSADDWLSGSWACIDDEPGPDGFMGEQQVEYSSSDGKNYDVYTFTRVNRPGYSGECFT